MPIKSGNYLGDWFGACLSALGALAALRWRDRTGEGQLVEMAQCEGLVRALDWTWLYAGLTGRDRARTGNRDPVFVPSGIYPCADGHVAIVAGTDAEFRGLAEALGRPDLVGDPRFEAAESRRHTPRRGRPRRDNPGRGAWRERAPTSRPRRGATASQRPR